MGTADLLLLLQRLESHPAGLALAAAGVVVAALAALRVILGVAFAVYAYFLRGACDLRRFGSWAVVTGCTDGIGLAYAEELAKRGLNLVLISRTQAKLERCASALDQRHPSVQTKVFAMDLCHADDQAYVKLAEELRGLDVGLLINNAGMGNEPYPDYLELCPEGSEADMIAVNALAPTLLAKTVLPGMKQRRRGVIVTIGSGVALLPSLPLTTVYAATKEYVEAFSQSLDAECRGSGVRVQNQVPMYVATKMSKVTSSLDKPSPGTWAAAAVEQIGRETSFLPYWVHGLQVAVLHLLPRAIVSRIARYAIFKKRDELKRKTS